MNNKVAHMAAQIANHGPNWSIVLLSNGLTMGLHTTLGFYILTAHTQVLQ